MRRWIFLSLSVLAIGCLFLAYQNAGLCEPEWTPLKTLETAGTNVTRCEAEGDSVIWDDASGSFSRPTMEVINEQSGSRHVRVYSCDNMHQLKFEVRVEELKPGCSVASVNKSAQPEPSPSL